jgi:hypothetical protein
MQSFMSKQVENIATTMFQTVNIRFVCQSMYLMKILVHIGLHAKCWRGEVRLCYLFSCGNIPPGAVHDSLGILLGVNIPQQDYQQHYSEPPVLLQGSKLIVSAMRNGIPHRWQKKLNIFCHHEHVIMSSSLNLTVQWLAILLRIWWYPDSFLGSETGSPDWGYLDIFGEIKLKF